MISTGLCLLQTLGLVLSAPAVLGRWSSRESRQRACLCSGIVLIWSACGLALTTWKGFATDSSAPYPCLVALVTFVAVSLSSASGTRPSTYATILALGATSTAAVWLQADGWLLLLFLAQTLLAALELRHGDKATWRLFMLAQTASLALVAAGLADSGERAAWLLAAGLMVRAGSLPFHGWVLRLSERAPMGLVVALVTPQLALLLQMRLLPPSLLSSLAAWAVATALYGAALATRQRQLKRTLGYLMISQSGLVAFGLGSRSELGHTGGLTAWLVAALALSGLAMTCEALAARHAGALSLDQPGADFESTPLLATSFLLHGLALAGLPGSLGFVAEDILVQGTLAQTPALSLAMIVVTSLNAITVMRCVLTLFVGPRQRGFRSDLVARERLAVGLLLGSLFLLGVFPRLCLVWFA